jgi:type I restriction enzyme S subunit
MRKIKLSQCGSYVTKERINSNKLNVNNYITTDNMLPNKEGICDAEKIPTNITVNHFQENDILLSNIRPYFKKIWKAEYEGGCSADVLIFRTNSGYNADFIRYCLSQDAFFDYDMKGAKGSKMPRGDKNHILNFELYDFSLPSQTSIASVLKVLDNKIILNNKINNELEQMAKTLYDYWFVQFDFPDEKGRPYKSANGKMVYNEVLKREIPEGWEVIKFDDLVEQAPKLKAIKAPDYKNQGNIPIVDQASTLITGRTDDMSYYYKNERNCVVFGDVTTCFKYINFPFAKGTDGTKIINAKDDRIPAILLYQLLKDTKLPNIGFARHYMFLREIKLLLPPQDICEKYYQATKGIMDLRAKNLKENYKLSITRDFLLPLLMNGQVSVQD